MMKPGLSFTRYLRAIFCISFIVISEIVNAADSVVTDSIFSPNSFWYTPIPANTTLNENSDNYVQEFLRQKNHHYGTVTINTSQYASPVYYVAANVPNVKVVQWDCQHKGIIDKSLAEQFSQVPIPDYAMPASGTDAEMSIYQASTNTLWEFWKAKKENGQWKACWGGRIQNASKNTGAFDRYYGTTATSLPFIGGQITAEELKRGEIKHVMGISLVELEHWKVFSWPAHRSDGFNPGKIPNRIPEGTRFRLDPTVDVDALKMHPIGKIIAKAAQKYGFVVWDRAGAISLRAQNPYTYTAQGQPNPYDDLFAGSKAYAILSGFPWDKLQFLPMNYNKPN